MTTRRRDPDPGEAATTRSPKQPSRDPDVARCGLPEFVYHLTFAANATGIVRDGLRTAAELLAAAGMDAESANGHRRGRVLLPTGTWLRDQRPMPPAALARCLDPPLTPDDWYRLINARVFFWPDRDRLIRHWAVSRGTPMICYTVQTARLAERHAAAIELSPFNSGSAMRRAARRGHRSFVPLADWCDSRWAAEAAPDTAPRAKSHKPAELTVHGPIPDFMSFVVAERFAPPA